MSGVQAERLLSEARTYALKNPMPRVLSIILAFAAMIIQIGVGVLPTGEGRVCVPVSASERCCDEEQECLTQEQAPCPCRHGCERCICIPTPDGNARPVARPAPTFGDQVAVSAMLPSVSTPVVTGLPIAVGVGPRVTESPPHLSLIRVTRLVI